VDCSNSRDFQFGQTVEDPLSFRDKRAQISGLRLLQQRLQIRAGDKYRFFS
jgi:hypothetical protein